jgi:predicted nucleic acid-binding protein
VIYLDTSFLYALFNTQDEDHPRVREVFESYRGRQLSDLVVTTPQIIFETITLIRFGKGEGRPDAKTRHRQPSTPASASSAGSWRGYTSPATMTSAQHSTTSSVTTTRNTALSTA